MIHANYRPALEWLAAKRAAWRPALEAALIRAGDDILGDIQTTQWGGRHGDKGLNIRTGNLFNSGSVDVTEETGAMLLEVKNHNARYWYVHDKESGGELERRTEAFGRETRPFWVRIPKRTDVRGEFMRHGPIFVQARVEDALQAVFG